MFYFLHGENEMKAREKVHSLLDSLSTKKPNASIFNIDSDTFNDANIDELIEGQGLFENKYIVFFNKIFLNKNIKENILEKLKEIAESQNIFLFLEGKVDKKTLKKIEKFSAKTLEFKNAGSLIKKEKKFNIFDLADAFGRLDKKKLWVLYNKSKMYGVSPEEVHNILVWQTKAIYLSKNSKSASESGLNPFVFNKANTSAKNFTNGKLKKISSELVSIYHNARRGISEFDISLEQFLLSIISIK
jgi:DNA polymerase III delta subunit